MTANLQNDITVKQAARLMNVSERSVYNAKRLCRSGREDLCSRVERGELMRFAPESIGVQSGKAAHAPGGAG